MATHPGPLYDWPWARLGNFKITALNALSTNLAGVFIVSSLAISAFCLEKNFRKLYKYALYIPIIVKATQANLFGGYDKDNFCLHMLVASALRYLQGQMWMTLSRTHHIIEKYQIQQKPISFQQVDRESNWEDYILLHTILIIIIHASVPGNLPLWDWNGILIMFLLHVGPTEFAYYWLHRVLHHHYLFTRYHSHHHASFVTEAVTGTVHPFLEHISYVVVLGLPILGTWALGGGSIGMIYLHWLLFDFMNCMGHCNWEFFPPWVFNIFPPLKYLIYTPTYHSLHHSQVHTNFALFMPLYDYLGGTVDKNSDSLYQTVRKGRTDKVDFIFLVHATEILGALHQPAGIASFAAHPFQLHWYLLPMWPLAAIAMVLFWIFGKVYVLDKYKLNNLSLQTWVMPRFGFQYFLKFGRPSLNKLIEEAILRAEAKGCQVFTLGALNKMEALNGGGALFVKKNPNLRMRVVHGNTLTVAAILDKLPKETSSIFLTGSTSKIGRAIALHLCRQRVRVLMLTTSRERFERILHEAPVEFQEYLVQVTKYQAGKDCKTWVMGKWAFAEDQKWAPTGTHFHQFVLPPIQELRKDCTYGGLVGMRLPQAVMGYRTCELAMPRGCVYACHAGGLVHALEGWKHNEVGAIDIDQIDVTWKAAMKHGFLPL